MRDLLTGLAIIVILGLSAAMAAPWFIDWDAWRGEVEQRAAKALGREVRISGPIAITLLPQPRFSAKGVSIAAAQAPAELSADSVELEISLTALVAGQLKITDGTVERPVLIWRDRPVSASPMAAPDVGQSVSIEKLSLRGARFRALDAGGATLVAMNGDVDLEAASMAGPWKAQARVEADGRRYDLRWTSGVMGEDGRAPVKFGVQSVGLSFLLDGDGGLLLDRKAWREPLRFEGRVTATGMLPWPFGRGAGAQPWRVAATGTADLREFAMSAVEIEAGPQEAGFKAEGDGAVRYVAPLSARAALKVKTLDLEKILAADAGATPNAPPAQTPEELEKLLAAIPFPVALEMVVDRGYIAGDSFGPVSGSFQLEPGVVRIEKADAQGPGGLKASGAGRLWIDTEPAFEGALNVSSSAPAKAWSWLSGAAMESVRNPRFARATHASADGKLRWRPGRIALDDVAVSLDGAQARISAQRRFPANGDPGRIGLDMRADKLDLDLAPPISLLTPADGPDISIAISAKELMSQALGVSLGALDLDARQQAGVLTLSKLSLRQKGFSLTADAAVKNGVGRMTAELAADDLQPLATALQRAAPGKASDALAARATLLSPARLSASVQPSRDGALWLARLVGAVGETKIDALAEARAGTPGQSTVNVESLRVNAEAADAGRLIRQLGRDAAASTQPGSFALAIIGAADRATSFTLNAAIAGAAIEASGDAITGLTPAVAGRFSLNAGDIRPALTLLGLPVAATAPQPAWLQGPLEFGASGLRLPQLAGVIAGKEIRTASLWVSLADDPKASGRIEFGELSLAELTQLALGIDPSAGASFWSAARFPAFAGWSAPFDLELAAPRFSLGAGWVASAATVRLVSRNDGVRLESATADLAGGKLTASGAARRDGGLASLTGRFDLRGADLPTLGATGVAGKIDLGLDLAGSGDALSRMIASVGGAGSVTLRNLTLPQLDPAAAARVTAAQTRREGLPSIDAVASAAQQELARSPLTIDVAAMPLTMANGAMRAGPMRVDQPNVFATGSAQVDLRSLTLDARGVMSGRNGDALTPDIGVAFSGPLANPRRTLDASSLFGDLTQKAAAREAERIETLEQDARERASFNRRLRTDRQRSEMERQQSLQPPQPAPLPPPQAQPPAAPSAPAP